jgi:hypothetical protein
MLNPTSQLPLSNDRRRVQLHHGVLHRQRSVGGWVGNWSSCDVLLAHHPPARTLGGRDRRSL